MHPPIPENGSFGLIDWRFVTAASSTVPPRDPEDDDPEEEEQDDEPDDERDPAVIREPDE
jgi:hypothetical protein